MIARSPGRPRLALLALGACLGGCTGQIGGEGPYGAEEGSAAAQPGAPGTAAARPGSPGVPPAPAPGGTAAPAGGTSAPSSTGSAAAAPEAPAFDRAVRRLSARELEADIDAWFPELAATRKRMVGDSSGLFDNSAADLDTSAEWIDGLLAFSADFVSLAARNDAVRARVRVCKEETGTCLREIVRTWGRRLLRRPLADDEIARVATTLEGSQDLRTVDERAFAALEVFLHHPEHVFRIEAPRPGGAVADHAIAARLSYALWGRGPDDTLLDEAGAGGLADARRRRAIAERMLGGKPARQQMLDFHAQWMEFDGLPRASLGAAMWDETRRLVDRVIFDEPRLGYAALFQLEETFLTPALATHYGVRPPDGSAPAWTRPSDPTRRGILGHGTFLSAHPNPDDTSPVKRGKAVLENLLCNDPLVPPPDVAVDEKPKPGQCRLDFFANTHAAGSCAGCHRVLDGIGFGLERFDKFGAAREHEPGKTACRLDGRGQFLGSAFEGPAGLAALLVKSEGFDACVVRQMLRFAVGRDPGIARTAFFERARTAYLGGNRSVREMLLAAIADPAFVASATR